MNVGWLEGLCVLIFGAFWGRLGFLAVFPVRESSPWPCDAGALCVAHCGYRQLFLSTLGSILLDVVLGGQC